MKSSIKGQTKSSSIYSSITIQNKTEPTKMPLARGSMRIVRQQKDIGNSNVKVKKARSPDIKTENNGQLDKYLPEIESIMQAINLIEGQT